MRCAQVRKMDISNGPGVRVSLFTQGSDLHCKGCFNSEAWDYSGGKKYTDETKDLILDLCSKPHIAGLSILGGEPLSPLNYSELFELLTLFREMFPDKDIWMWTGRIYEEMTEEQLEITNLCDVIVDGPWIQDLGDFSLKYKGSSNQRVIDINKTKELNKVVLYEGK